MPSPSFSINAGSPLVKASAARNGSFTCLLDDTSGVAPVTWSLVLFDDTTVSADWLNQTQSGAVGEQFDFDAPTDAEGVCAIVECTVHGGLDGDGNSDTTMTARAKVYVPTQDGLEPLAAGEVSPDPDNASPQAALWSSLTHGAASALNDVIRSIKAPRYVHSTLSNGGAAANLLQYDAPDDRSLIAFAVVCARDSVNGDSASWWIARQFENTSGTLTALAGQVVIVPAQKEDVAWDCTLDTTSDMVTITATDDAANASVWDAWLFVFEGG